MTVARKWTREEDAALRGAYAEHGAVWPGWRDVLPGRSVNAIYRRATHLGVRNSTRGRKPKPRAAEPPRPPRPATCGGCRHYREGAEPGCGRCVERHARGWFQGAPAVMARYDASLCEWGERA